MNDLLRKISPLRLTFGGASISGEGGGYGFGDISEDNSVGLLSHAYDRGIKIFDTAPIYGFRNSEKRIGKAFNMKREDVFIISKSGVSWHDNNRVNMSNDPKITLKMLETTLKDLKSSYVDLYMIHWPDQHIDIRVPMEVLAKAKHEGKIKHIGLCNTYPEDIHKASEVEHIEVIQSEFNLFTREYVIESLFKEVKEKERSFMTWGTLDKGILTGRADKSRKYDDSDARSWAPWWKKSNLDFKFRKYEELKTIFDEYKISGLDLAISHNLMYDEVGHIIIGARTVEQLDGVFDSIGKKVPTEAIQKAIKIIDNE